ncbi:MAG: single-stranded-DNA-specific exonuclease RecJ [Bryobacterales bacterium]|nr:single-stranded-DNA-specific exonuclease RecJ [Bryobacterales bacterium]
MRKPARWNLPQFDRDAVTALSRELGVSPLLARILCRRGFPDPGAALRFLQPSPEDLHDPFLLRGMREGVARLSSAIALREPILLYGDYDVDGTTSVVILKKVLELAGADASFHVPHRVKDGYGMRPEVITEAASRGIKLIVSVDTGIRANAVVQHARELGIDVIVTDHHLPESELPPAVAVLNPNQPGCGYPEKNLCGAGVVLKLVQALLLELGIPEARRRRLLDSLLKLAAIATVADVVPLTGENRVIVRFGLAGLSSTPNPGLRALLEAAGFGEGVAPSAGQVAFRVAPRINAAGRMDTARDVVEMFLTSDTARAREIAAHLHSLNAARQDTEAGMLAQALDDCQRDPVTDDQRGLVFAGTGWHKGVVGIVASRLVERFCRPVFVLGIDPEKGEAAGSGRSANGFHLLEALESMADLFTKFGGHKQAAGITLPADRIPEFRRRFTEYTLERLSVEDLCPVIDVDALARVEEVGPHTVREWALLGPFGFGNPTPVVAFQGVTVPEPPVLMKEKHLRFRIAQDRRWLTCKGWNWASRLAEIPIGSPVDVVAAVEEDTYSGGVSAILKDVRPSTCSPSGQDVDLNA